MTSIFTLRKLRQMYAGRVVLDIDELDVRKGEILAIVGPSGAGKSTLLRILNFLEQSASGTLTFDDDVVTPTLPIAQRRRVTTVFQQPILLKRSVEANLKYGVRLRGNKLPPLVLTSYLDRLGLTSLADQSAQKLSGGEAQRVALARALLVNPDVLLMDEPTANLDPYNVGLIERIVQEVNEEQKTTVVMVTHNIFQARRIAHRTALMLGGKIIEIGPTEEFFHAPQKPETAAFLRGELVF